MACQHAAGGGTGRGHAGERAKIGIRFGAAGGQTADGGRQMEDVGWTLGWLGTEAPGGGGGGMACWHAMVSVCLVLGATTLVRPSAAPSRSLLFLPSLALGVLLRFFSVLFSSLLFFPSSGP